MTASANEYAEKTEKTHQLTWIAKSNSFRRSAKEKTSELKVFDEQLTAKLLQLKNCAWTACPWLRHVQTSYVKTVFSAKLPGTYESLAVV